MRHFVRAILAIVPLLIGPPVLEAQFEAQNPTTLVVKVCIGSFQNSAAADITVQLQDGFGAIEHERHTDARGMVEFSTFTATKRVRIFRPGIVEHEETIDIEPVETRKIVNIIVREAPKTGGPPSTAAGGVVPASRLAVPAKAQKEFQKGSESLSRKEWPEARKHFEQAIAIYPDYDIAYNGLGMASASSGDNQMARMAFEKAISLNADFAEAYRNLARISLSERKFDEVNALLTKSLAADPQNAWALAYAAYAELQLHKFDEAIDHARKVHALDHKGLASAHTVAALAFEATNRLSDALKEYELYLQEDPNGRDAPRAKERILKLKEDPGGR